MTAWLTASALHFIILSDMLPSGIFLNIGFQLPANIVRIHVAEVPARLLGRGEHS